MHAQLATEGVCGKEDRIVTFENRAVQKSAQASKPPAKPVPTWRIEAAHMSRFLRQLEPFSVRSRTLAGALRAFARYTRACDVTWMAPNSTLKLTVTRAGYRGEG